MRVLLVMHRIVYRLKKEVATWAQDTDTDMEEALR
jgi:hypothetical protein